MKIFSIKKLSLGLFGACLFFAITSPASAQTLDAGKLRIEYDGTGALFNETNIAPGYEAVRTVTVTNTGNVAHSFSIAVTGQLGKLAEVLQIEPRNFGTDTPIWNKTVKNIAKAPNSDIILDSIDPGQIRKVNIVAILPIEVGNDYQATSTFSFDFVMGNESTDQAETTPTYNTAITAASVDINRISTVARAPSTTPAVVSENAPTMSPSVTTEVSADNQGGVAGASAENEKVCFWWWVMLVILAILLIIYGIISRRLRGWFFSFWPAFMSALAYTVHWILQEDYTPSKWCHWWFVGILLAEVILYYIVMRVFRGKKEK